MADEKDTGSSEKLSGAARPSGKRQVTGETTATSTKTVEKRKKAAADKKTNPLSFFAQVWQEIRKVIWPTGKQMVQYTIIVLLFLILVTALVFGVDWAASWGIDQILIG
ncbi:preprotein translocase subunit SecE [Corynebacterium ulceribovis]|uniref:preprotein translocase subunit SecE n=1 Tax=Corynebacterium ulceribovis TaxID=487732 RepID=UPI000375366F|nr:preprotein translocase subunit SecE [Corynebacterium ulceribovis]